MKKDGIVMIVDDDRAMREMYMDFLFYISPDIKVRQAQNGREAVDKLEEFIGTDSFPDVILTDFEMPVMNGLELLKFIRNYSNPMIKNLQAVMISGNCSPALMANAANLNCKFLEKPITMGGLSSALFEK